MLQEDTNYRVPLLGSDTDNLLVILLCFFSCYALFYLVYFDKCFVNAVLGGAIYVIFFHHRLIFLIKVTEGIGEGLSYSGDHNNSALSLILGCIYCDLLHIR